MKLRPVEYVNGIPAYECESETCGNFIRYSGRGRHARFCSTACKMTEHRRVNGRSSMGHESRTRRRATAGFYGFDGEGLTKPNGRHILYTLRAGSEELTDLKGLSTDRCLRWMSELTESSVYVGFSLGYDFTMILRDLAQIRWFEKRRLLDHILDMQTWNGEDLTEKYHGPLIEHLGIRIRCIPGKFLAIYNESTRRRIRFSDTFGLFQTKFTDTLLNWNIIDVPMWEWFESFKRRRGHFTGADDEIEYNRQECRYLELLMAKVKAACLKAGIVPETWEGAGKLAEALFKLMGVPKREDQFINGRDLIWANRAYYGGWFEAPTNGNLDMPIYSYDINSAYPAAMADLPCFKRECEGRWEDASITEPRANSDCTMYEVSWQATGEQVVFGPFPVRVKNGAIQHPLACADIVTKIGRRKVAEPAREVYWQSEVIAALDAIAVGTDKPAFHIVIHSARTYVPGCSHKWLSRVPEFYLLRQEMSKGEGKLAAVILKLALNSLYGKTAQKVGAMPYLNLVWAGMITAHCRAMIMRASFTAEKFDDVVMVATDGIFSKSPLDVPVPKIKELGKWERTTYPDGMWIIQPGIYWSSKAMHDDGKFEDTAKTRGIGKAVLKKHIGPAIECWERYCTSWDTGMFEGELPVGKFKLFWESKFLGMKLGLAQRRYATIGNWIENPKITLDFRPRSKRSLTGVQRKILTEGLHIAYWPPIEKAKVPSYVLHDVEGPDGDEVANLLLSEDSTLSLAVD